MFLKLLILLTLWKVDSSPLGSSLSKSASEDISSLMTAPKLRKNVVSFLDLTQGIVDPQKFILKEEQVAHDIAKNIKSTPRSVSDMSLDSLIYEAAVPKSPKRITSLNYNDYLFQLKSGSNVFIGGLEYRIGEALRSKSKFITDYFALNRGYSVIITVFRTDVTDKYVLERLQQMYTDQKSFYGDTLMFSKDEDLILIGPLYVWHNYYDRVGRDHLRTSI